MRSRPAAVRTSMPSSGRSAASGLTRTTRRVGSQAATRVTTRPTREGRGVPGGARARRPPSCPVASARGPARPGRGRGRCRQPGRAARRPRPRHSASSRIDRSTCRRVAPTQRSSAKSRLRWANRIEKVLAMTRTETKSAMAAKTSSTIAITLTSLVISVCTLLDVGVGGLHGRAGLVARAARSRSSIAAGAGVRHAVDVEARRPALGHRPRQVERAAEHRQGCRRGRRR